MRTPGACLRAAPRKYCAVDLHPHPRGTDKGNMLTTERLFGHCEAHTAEPEIVPIGTIPPIPYYQTLVFSVALGAPQVRDKTELRSGSCTVSCIGLTLGTLRMASRFVLRSLLVSSKRKYCATHGVQPFRNQPRASNIERMSSYQVTQHDIHPE